MINTPSWETRLKDLFDDMELGEFQRVVLKSFIKGLLTEKTSKISAGLYHNGNESAS